MRYQCLFLASCLLFVCPAGLLALSTVAPGEETRHFEASARRGRRESNALPRSQAFPVLFSEGHVPLPDITVHYFAAGPDFEPRNNNINMSTDLKAFPTRQAGENKAPLFIFFHGFTSNGPLFVPFIAGLIDEINVVVPELRGHGRSQGMPRGTFTFEQLEADCTHVLRHFSGTLGFETIAVGGGSMGASLAAHVALAHGDKLVAAVLEDPPWMAMPFEELPPPRTNIGDFEVARVVKRMSEEEARDFENNSPVTMEMVTKYPQAIDAVGGMPFRQMDADSIEPTFAEMDREVRRAVGGISVPVLLQTSFGPSLHPGLPGLLRESVKDEIVKTYAYSEWKDFPTAGHNIHAHAIEWVLNVKDFLLRMFNLPDTGNETLDMRGRARGYVKKNSLLMVDTTAKRVMLRGRATSV